jgi:succinoglycan biosynthesis transport protein ExoP
LKFCGIGLALGVVVAILVAGGFEFTDDRVHSESALKAMLPTAILSEIPEVVHPSDEARSRRRLTLGWTMTAVVVVTILAGATISVLYG